MFAYDSELWIRNFRDCTVHLDIIKVLFYFHQHMHYIFAYEYIKIYIKIHIKIAAYAATSPNSPRRRILNDCFNNYNFS
jgi:hypothetical protein